MLEAMRSKKSLVTVAMGVLIVFVFLIVAAWGSENKAPVAKASVSSATGPAPHAVIFSSQQSSDPEDDPLTFTWNFGDGTTSAEANPKKTFEKSGKYTVVLKVSDKIHTSTAKSLTVTVAEASVMGASTETPAPTPTNKKRVLSISTPAPTQVIPPVVVPSIPPTLPAVVASNLIPNASFVDPYSTDVPMYWIEGSYGLSIADFTYESVGRTDSSSVSIAMSGYVFGDAKWIFESVTIEGGKSYKFKDWYKSDVQTEILIDYTLDDSTHQYELVGTVAPATDWTEYTHLFVAPVNAEAVSVHHMIKADGTLQLDDYSLIVQE